MRLYAAKQKNTSKKTNSGRFFTLCCVFYWLSGRWMRGRSLDFGSYSRMLRIPKYSASTWWLRPVASRSPPLAYSQRLKATLGFAPDLQSRILRVSKHSSNVAEIQAPPLIQLVLAGFTEITTLKAAIYSNDFVGQVLR